LGPEESNNDKTLEQHLWRFKRIKNLERVWRLMSAKGKPFQWENVKQQVCSNSKKTHVFMNKLHKKDCGRLHTFIWFILHSSCQVLEPEKR
jgi:hypothetical protein